jgi:hypothetical protein
LSAFPFTAVMMCLLLEVFLRLIDLAQRVWDNQ